MGNPGGNQACYLRAVSADAPPNGLLGRPLPDVTLLDTGGGAYRVRQFVGHQPLVLFFYILNGSPG